MVQYLARYTPNLAEDLSPIHHLTRKDTQFVWSKKCDDALNHLKWKLCKAPVLAYYDRCKPLVLQVDSSKDGLGAVMLQDGRPVEYASRNLRSNEKNWPQIDKEALAVIWALEKFDQYTYARPVEIHNDHKPLETIFKKAVNQASRRMQGLMIRLFRYNTTFTWVKGSELYLADTLSRAFLNDCNDSEPEMHVLAVQTVRIPDQRTEAIRKATISDDECAILIPYILDGWPDHRYQVHDEAKVYFDVRDTLSYEDGAIYKGERIVIPKDLRPDIITKLHASHLGTESMMRRARETVFWPGMMRELKELCENCVPCMDNKPRNQKETLIQHEETQFQWQKIGCDLFTIEGHDYLVIVDYDTDFIEVEAMTTTSSARVITSIKKACARYGIPSQLVSDGGPQFVSHEFKEFTQLWGINHVITSPYHSQSNGKAESAVKIIKGMMRKCIQANSDQYLALLEFRSTPRQDGPSPAFKMFGRKLNTNLPMKNSDNMQNIYDRKRERRESVKKSYDRNAIDLPDLPEGQTVLFKKQPQAREWEKGRVVSQHGDRSYVILGETGGTYRRNRVHIRPTQISFEPQARDDPVPHTYSDIIQDNNVNQPMASLGSDPVSVTVPNAANSPRRSTGPSPVVTNDRPRRVRDVPKRLQDYDLSGPK